jgi:hypothetical protein
MKKWIAIFLLSASAVAQAPAPQLSASTTIAVNAIKEQLSKIQEQYRQVQAAISAIDEDVKKDHPGFHLNPQTLAVEADAPKTTSPTPPASKK